MNILFSGVPAYGHLLPMLPLASAADLAGHSTALLTSTTMSDAVSPLRVLAAGPSFSGLLAENAHRNGGMGSGNGSQVGPAEAAQFFGETRIDTTFPDALPAAASFCPDLLVCDAADQVGPLVAAALCVPWTQHGFGVQLPDAFSAAIDAAAGSRYDQRALRPTEPVAYLDPCADLLQPHGWTPGANRLAVRPQAHTQPGFKWDPPDFPRHRDRPLVLVTFGTVVDDAELMPAVLASLESSHVNVVVTVRPDVDPDSMNVDRTRVRPINFVPLGQLLEGVSAVVCAGGAGTVLGALAEGVPLVVLPLLASQRWNGGQAAAAGTAVTISEPGQAGLALETVLHDPSYRAAARTARRQIAAMPSADQAMSALLRRLDVMAVG